VSSVIHTTGIQPVVSCKRRVIRLLLTTPSWAYSMFDNFNNLCTLYVISYVDSKPIGKCSCQAHTHACIHGRTGRKHNAFGWRHERRMHKKSELLNLCRIITIYKPPRAGLIFVTPFTTLILLGTKSKICLQNLGFRWSSHSRPTY